MMHLNTSNVTVNQKQLGAELLEESNLNTSNVTVNLGRSKSLRYRNSI